MKIIFEQKVQIDNFDQVVGFLMERLIYLKKKDIFSWINDILTSRPNTYCCDRCIGNANVMKGPPGASSDRLSVYLSVRLSVWPYVCLSVIPSRLQSAIFKVCQWLMIQ